MSLVSGLIVIAMIIWQLLGIGWRGWVGLQTFLGARKRRSVDVSYMQLSPSPQTQNSINSLVELGFQRLGEAQVKLPFRSISTVWILVNAENFVQAETIYNRVSFSTFFDDNVLVVTDYPNGEHIETPSYQSHTITSGINDAFYYHLQQVDKFKTKYGSPHIISNMADYCRWETMGRVNYGFRKTKRFFLLDAARLIIFIYGVIIIMGLPLFSRSILTQEKIELMTIGLTLPVLFVPGILSRWAIKVSNQDSRRIV
jgi:hypothetical protein